MTSAIRTVTVLAEDLRQGVRGDCARCALALAAQRDLEGEELEVDANGVVFAMRQERNVIAWNPVDWGAVFDFIETFDEQSDAHNWVASLSWVPRTFSYLPVDPSDRRIAR